MDINEFDYYLPKELIAQEPPVKRGESRLLVVRRDSQSLEHTYFNKLPHYLSRGDALVLNDTKVIPARLMGVKKGTGGKVELFLLKEIKPNLWEVLVKPSKRVKLGQEIIFGNGKMLAKVIDFGQEGTRIVSLEYQGMFEEVLAEIGILPLPPYIKKKLKDPERYQTVYAKHIGSVAAPTAGLHFTPELLEELTAKGVKIIYITLHVGLGTFRPVKVEDIEKHKMHSEYYEVSHQSAQALNQVLHSNNKIIAVGTTSCRVLETIKDNHGFHPRRGWTDIFIYPGYKFKAIDALITNFHLPRSTLIMLVCAFGGRELIMKSYREAVEKRYRFYSFGDAMLIL